MVVRVVTCMLQLAHPLPVVTSTWDKLLLPLLFVKHCWKPVLCLQECAHLPPRWAVQHDPPGMVGREQQLTAGSTRQVGEVVGVAVWVVGVQ